MTEWRIALGVLASLVATALEADDTLRCGSRLVALGDDRAQVRAVCGEPALMDPWDAGVSHVPGRPQVIEEWTYDFGSRELLRVLRFRNGRLRAIDAAGYGFSRPPDGDCAPEMISVGMAKYRLLRHCGQPQSAEAVHLLAPPRRANGALDGLAFSQGQVVEVYRERWRYDFGPRRLQREVTLENGRAVEVREGERGTQRERQP